MLSQVNWIGLYTLYKKEVWRFMKVYNQTLLAPVVTSLLFLAVFSLAMTGRVQNIGGIPFQEFMAAGLIMMAVVQNAFANTSSALTMGKVLGTIVDYLMPPLTPGEMIMAMTLGALTRGVIVGILVGFAVYVFVPVHISHIGYALFYLIISSMMLALIGLLAGIFSESFDQMSAISSYIITPLAFLSGTFYSVKRLPDFWYHVSQYNPFFYMIDGFRYGMTGYNDGSIQTGIIVLIASVIVLWTIAHILLTKGYRIKV